MILHKQPAAGFGIVAHLGQSLTPTVSGRLRSAHPRSVGIHGARRQSELAGAERLAGAELQELGYPLLSGAGVRAGALTSR